MTRDEILRLADKHSTLTAGWLFSAADMADFYQHAYEAGAAAEREECARVCDGIKGLAARMSAVAIRSRGEWSERFLKPEEMR